MRYNNQRTNGVVSLEIESKITTPFDQLTLFRSKEKVMFQTL